MGQYKRCMVCEQEVPLIAETGMCGPCTFGTTDAIGEGELIPKRQQRPGPLHFGPKPGDFIKITKAEMDAFFRADKGWVCYDNQGWEYVYEFCVPDSIIRIRVGSGISTGKDHRSRDNTIRVYAIGYETKPKYVFGLCKSLPVKPSLGWQDRIKARYKEALDRARINLSVQKRH